MVLTVAQLTLIAFSKTFYYILFNANVGRWKEILRYCEQNFIFVEQKLMKNKFLTKPTQILRKSLEKICNFEIKFDFCKIFFYQNISKNTNFSLFFYKILIIAQKNEIKKTCLSKLTFFEWEKFFSSEKKYF